MINPSELDILYLTKRTTNPKVNNMKTLNNLLKDIAPKTFAIYYDMEIVANGHDTDPSETAKDVVSSVVSTTLEDLRIQMEEIFHDDPAYWKALNECLRSEGH